MPQKLLPQPRYQRIKGNVREQITLGKIGVIAVAALVAIMIGFSLWVSLDGIIAKIAMTNGVHQIVNLVADTREIAISELDAGVRNRDDLLARLVKISRYDAAGNKNGLTFVTNPWGGPVTVFSTAKQSMRVETSVPPRICWRIIYLFTKDVRSFGLQEIDVQPGQSEWRHLYDNSRSVPPGNAEIQAACASDTGSSTVLALTFTLR